MIPTEIVDHILSLLHSDQDYTTLETCAIVFPHVVDRHLYSKIAFYASNWDSTSWDPMPHSILNFNKRSYVVDATQFSQVLTDRPHVGNYVRVIQITLNLNLPLLKTISSILSNLSQLESISLSATLPLSWSVLDHEFHTAFLSSIRLPSIKKVAIFNIDAFPLNTFDDCKNLKALQIYGQCTDGDSLSSSSYPRLCSLGVDRQPDWTRMVSWTKSNNLHTLSLRMHSRQEFLQFRTLLEACRNTLVKLELNCWGISSRGTSKRFRDLHKKKLDEILLPFRSDLQSSTVTPVFPELQLPVLEHIIFRSYVIVTSPRTFHSSHPSLVPVLTSIKTISALSPIRLTICFQFIGPFKPARDIDWSRIAAILILPFFHHPVELYLSCLGGMEAEFLDVLASFEQNPDMNRLLGDGKLVLINDINLW